MSDKMEDEIIRVAKSIESLVTQSNSMPDFVKNDKAHQDAVAFLQTDGDGWKNNDWLLEYGKSLWEYRTAIFNRIDEKADSIIKYLGGGTGIFALGIIAKVDAANYYLIFWCAPSVMCSLIAIWLAILARRPRPVASLPTVSQAVIEYASAYPEPDLAKAAFVAQWNLACVDMKLVCTRKADLLELANRFYFLALAFLVLPLAAAAICPPATLAKS